MPTTTTDIDYKKNFFEHPEVTRIVGEPSTATLITLQAEICDNAQSVQSDLGGGEHGHLGLVCTPEAYLSLVPNTEAYIRPKNPGRLAVKDGLTGLQIGTNKLNKTIPEILTHLFCNIWGCDTS